MFKKKQEVLGRPKGQKTKKVQSLFGCFGKSSVGSPEKTVGGKSDEIFPASTKDTDEEIGVTVRVPVPRTSVDPNNGLPRRFFEIDRLPTSGRRLFHLNGTSVFYLQMNPPGKLFVKVELTSGCELDWVWRNFLDEAVMVPFSHPDHQYATLDESIAPASLNEHDGTSWVLPCGSVEEDEPPAADANQQQAPQQGAYQKRLPIVTASSDPRK